MAIHPQEASFRTLAKALLGAFLFLLAASFWVLPCLATSTSDLFSSVAGPMSCQEHKIFEAQADLGKFEFLPAGGSVRFLAVLPAVFAAASLAYAAAAARSRPGGRIRVRTGSLPFITSDPPRLPAFAALRDA